MSASFQPGAIVQARGREWVVLPPGNKPQTLRLRPLGGSDDDATIIYLPLEREPPRSATFPVPDPARPGNQSSGLLLRDALRLKLRAGAGPFRSMGNIAVEPRAYQLVPLLMALKQDVVRLLVADDVGIGKTIEAGLIFRELLDRGEIQRLAVICPPHLCEQWQRELSSKFAIEAEIVRSGTAGRLDRGLPHGHSIFDEYPFTIVSLDFIKSEKRRADFLRACPEFVIVEEAHTCVAATGSAKQQRFDLLKGLAERLDRHIVMLTATPHSGNEEAFHNLLSLLDPKFADFAVLPEGTARRKLREELAAYFVQRRRPDIQEWRDSGLFPKRVPSEATWRITGASHAFFGEVLRYARELVARTEGKAKLEQRMSWWSALALLRCVSSSPAAAALALETRLKALTEVGEAEQLAEVERVAAETVMDGSDDSDLFMVESVPAGTTDTTAEADKAIISRLIEMALNLRGPKSDPKLKLLVEQVAALVKDGFRPVIFCRYIATAHYVAEHLGAALSAGKAEVIAITGELTPEEREERIESLAETCGADKIPVLVATDCLSEGINLQHIFNAVVHYDLSWNPTRHEQREGRADRYGQPSKEVRTVMIFGDHPVDGAVLQIILRKAERIKKDLGVSVPIPADGAKVMEAVMQAVLLRKGTPPAAQSNQLSFDFGDLEPVDKKLEKAWQTAKENETRSRTIFAQRRLRPDEVLPEWDKAVSVLGGPADVERFVTTACRSLGAPLDPKKGFSRLPLDHLPQPLKDRLAAAGILKPPRIAFEPTHVAGIEVVHRAHPLVIHLADYVAERTLAEDDEGLAARCAAIRTTAVKVLTTVHLLRLRSQITVERHLSGSRYGEARTLLAEECLAVAAEGSAAPRLLEEAYAMALMAAETSGNIPDALRQQLLTKAMQRLPDMAAAFATIARKRADDLLADHIRVRTAAVGKGESLGRRYSVSPTLPPDIIGVYVLQPVASF